MSIEHQNIVDFISTDENEREVIMTISDHLPWNVDLQKHQAALSDKINGYLDFALSGQLLEKYPNSVGKKIVIRLVYQYSPDSKAMFHLNEIASRIAVVGIMFRHQFLASKDVVK